MTEIDFVNCGVKPKGELFLRASELLLNLELDVKPYQKNLALFGIAYKLVQRYVRCQESKFHKNSPNWFIKRDTLIFMTKPCLQYPLQAALEFRDQIEKLAKGSALFNITLEIFHEYEIYCLHIAEIAKYVKKQQRIISSKRKFLRDILERRDGLICKGCGKIENALKLQIDHIKPCSLGGNSELENLQLLCPSCNSTKCDRPMEYLMKQLKKRQKLNDN